jgi:uncharacterized protein
MGPDCIRYDRAELAKPERLANGMLRLDARIGRTGILVYSNGKGQERREYRPPEEAFKRDHLESLRLAPLTLGHPPVGSPVTAANAYQYVRGASEAPRQDGEFIAASLLVMHEDAVRAVESGTHREISEGYFVQLDETPGVTPDGERYDAVQRDLRANHIALVTKGRAGPDVSVRMDTAAEDAWFLVEDTTTTTVPRQDGQEFDVKITLDGVGYDAPEQTAQAVTAHLAKRDEEAKALRADADTAKAALDAEKARADAAEAAKAQAEQERNDAADPGKVKAAVKARIDLERSAIAVLGSDFKCDSLEDEAIKGAVIEKVFALKTDGQSETYVQGLFDAALAQHAKAPNPGLAALRSATIKADSSDGRKSPEAARAEMIKRNREMHLTTKATA